eukprot:3090462-Rhodomonas_salina.2
MQGPYHANEIPLLIVIGACRRRRCKREGCSSCAFRGQELGFNQRQCSVHCLDSAEDMFLVQTVVVGVVKVGGCRVVDEQLAGTGDQVHLMGETADFTVQSPHHPGRGSVHWEADHESVALV